MRARDELRANHRLSQTERQLLEAMLPSGHPHREALLAQAEVASVKWLDSSGQPAIIFEVNALDSLRLATDGVVSEAQAVDRDGGVMHMLLHVRGGFLEEIEVYREDGGALIEFPTPSGLTLE